MEGTSLIEKLESLARTVIEPVELWVAGYRVRWGSPDAGARRFSPVDADLPVFPGGRGFLESAPYRETSTVTRRSYSYRVYKETADAVANYYVGHFVDNGWALIRREGLRFRSENAYGLVCRRLLVFESPSERDTVALHAWTNAKWTEVCLTLRSRRASR